jgi:hypothetical protein
MMSHSTTRFAYRLDSIAAGTPRLVRWRPWIIGGALVLGAAAAGAAWLAVHTLAIGVGGVAVILVGAILREPVRGREREALPPRGEIEVTERGLAIHNGRGPSLRPWHTYDSIAYDPADGLLTLVPVEGFALTLSRQDIPNLDELVELLRRQTRIEIESAHEDDVACAS